MEKAMSSRRGIEQLPEDGLREIMVRVARQPQGASDLARIFAVSTTFRNFIEDSDVLRAVSFRDLLPGLSGQYETFSEVGGLVARCARAGNLDAQLILAKVVMVSASKFCNTNFEAAHSSLDRYSTRSTENYSIGDVEKAARLLNHFSAHYSNPKEVLDLVKNFLCQAKVQDVAEMQHHLKNFVALYLVPDKQHEHEMFLRALDMMCENRPFPLKLTTDPRGFLTGKFNEFCKSGYDMMKSLGLDEELFRPVLESVFQITNDVKYEAVLQRLDIVEPILKVGGEVASAEGNRDVLLVYHGVLCVAITLRRYLVLVIEHEAHFLGARDKLLSSYWSVFYL